MARRAPTGREAGRPAVPKAPGIAVAWRSEIEKDWLEPRAPTTIRTTRRPDF